MRRYRNFVVATLLCLVLPLQGANAYSECTVNISRVFSGDNGHVWVFFAQGGAAYLSPTDPDKEATLALAMTALVASRPVIVRYEADGVACNVISSRGDLTGFFLS